MHLCKSHSNYLDLQLQNFYISLLVVAGFYSFSFLATVNIPNSPLSPAGIAKNSRTKSSPNQRKRKSWLDSGKRKSQIYVDEDSAGMAASGLECRHVSKDEGMTR